MTGACVSFDQSLTPSVPMSSQSRFRPLAVLGLGWLAYGLVYATVLAAVVGLPIALAVFLLRAFSG